MDFSVSCKENVVSDKPTKWMAAQEDADSG